MIVAEQSADKAFAALTRLCYLTLLASAVIRVLLLVLAAYMARSFYHRATEVGR